MITIRTGICLALLVLTLPGCSREQQDWHAAEVADTIGSYGQFVQRHPDSELTTQARTRIAQLEEDRDWQHAGSADTAAAYREFLTQHPAGRWSQEARIRIENFALGAAEAAAPAVAPAAPAVAPAAPAVAPAAATVASGAPPAAGAATPPVPTPTSSPYGFAVQLGAFSTQAAAANAWQALSTRFAGELRGMTPNIVSGTAASGQLFRLQAAVADEARARALCDALRKQSQACVPLSPR